MDLTKLGDFTAASWMLPGLRSSQSLLDSGLLHSFVLILFLALFLHGLWQAVSHRKYLYLFVLFPASIFVGLLMKPTVDVHIAPPTNLPVIDSEIAALQTTIEPLKQLKSNGDAKPSELADLTDYETQLQKLETMRANMEGQSVAQVPLLEALMFDVGQDWGLLVDYLLSRTHPIDPATHVIQSQILAAVSQRADLSPAERLIAQQSEECLLNENRYLNDLEKTKAKLDAEAQMTGKSVQTVTLGEGMGLPPAGAVLPQYAQWLAKRRMEANAACHGVSQNLLKAVDAQITPADVSNVQASFSIDGYGIGGQSTQEMRDFLGSTIGLDKSQIAAMSNDQLAHTFLRYRRLQALSQQINTNIQNQLAADGTPLPDQAPVKSWFADKVMQFLAGFPLMMRNLIPEGIRWCWMYLFMGWPLVALLSLVPRQHLKIMGLWGFAVAFLFSWQAIVTFTQSYSAQIERQDISIRAKPHSAWQWIGRLASGMADQSPVTGVNAAGGLGTFGLGASKLSSIESVANATRAFLSSDLVAATRAIPGLGWVVTGGATAATLGLSGENAYKKIQKQGTGMEKFLQSEDLALLNPAIAGLAGGVIEQQRRQMVATAKHVEMIEGLFLMISPLLTSVFFFFGYKGIAATGIGQAAGGVLNNVGGAVTGKLGSKI